MPTVFICKSAGEIAGHNTHSHNVEPNAATTAVCVCWNGTALQFYSGLFRHLHVAYSNKNLTLKLT